MIICGVVSHDVEHYSCNLKVQVHDNMWSS